MLLLPRILPLEIIPTEELAQRKLLDEQRYVYVWRNARGEARGFLIGHKEPGERGAVLDCARTFRMRNGLLFTDAQALLGLFHFVKSAFSSDYSFIRFTLPASLSMASLVGENNVAAGSVSYPAMLRVTHVEKVLAACSARGSGTLRLRILDGMIPQNTGIWTVSFAPGQPNRVRFEEDGPADDVDATLPIGDFSALICGARRARDIPWMPQVRLHASLDRLEALFYEKACGITDFY